MLVVTGRYIPALVHLGRVDVDHIGGRAANREILQRLRLVFYLAAPERHRRGRLDIIRVLQDRSQVVHRDVFVALALLDEFLEARYEPELVDYECIRPEVGYLVLDVSVESLDQRHHYYHGGDPQDDSQQRQKRPEFVRRDRRQRQP